MPRHRHPNPSLATVTKYRNEAVVRRYAKDFGLSLSRSRRVFTAMLTFLWLANRHLVSERRNAVGRDRAKTFDMLPIWYGIDEMWHRFILFSLDYHAFCSKYFGRYVHHRPRDDHRGAGRGRRDRPRLSLEEYLRFTYDTLGAAAATRWFRTYPRTMSRAVMQARRVASLERQLAAGAT